MLLGFLIPGLDRLICQILCDLVVCALCKQDPKIFKGVTVNLFFMQNESNHIIYCIMKTCIKLVHRCRGRLLWRGEKASLLMRFHSYILEWTNVLYLYNILDKNFRWKATWQKEPPATSTWTEGSSLQSRYQGCWLWKSWFYIQIGTFSSENWFFGYIMHTQIFKTSSPGLLQGKFWGTH